MCTIIFSVLLRATVAMVATMLMTATAVTATTATATAAATAATVATSLTAATTAEQISVKVPGMVCQMCVQGMRKAFKDVVASPERDVKVDLEKKLVHVKLKSSLTDDEIKKRIRGTGYKAQAIERKKK